MIYSKQNAYERIRYALIRCSRERYISASKTEDLAYKFARCIVTSHPHFVVSAAIMNEYWPGENPIRGCHVHGLFMGEVGFRMSLKVQGEINKQQKKKRTKKSKTFELAV